jgi:hypothetical protein
MTWNPDQHDDHAIVRYEGRPNEASRPAEKTRWQRFLEFIHIKSRKTGELGEAYADAEVAKKKNEAAKVAADAADIAAHADLTRIKVVKAVNDEIERIFSEVNLPPAARMMQLNVLAKEHPEIMEQLDKLESIEDRLRLNRGVRIQIAQDEPAASTPPSAGHEGSKSV